MSRNDPLDAFGWQPAAGMRPTNASAPAGAGGNRTIRYFGHPFA